MMESPAAIAGAQPPTRASTERPIDLVHLARMTLGDRGLEREVLALFDRQATILVARMREAGPEGVASVAHTLKGSARGVGAWRVAGAAEAVEQAASTGEADDLDAAIGRLAVAAEEARAVITELLRAN
jgi:HPt (histidine-containing phosphotransfer) domain-containing protein